MAAGRASSRALAAVLLLVALSQQGCEDIYRLTCVWHSDLNIRGCGYYGFRECIQHCTYCITSNGPDECGQLKCASLCAKREGDECATNYKALCNIALEENFLVNTSDGGTRYVCDVNCNSAGGFAPSRWLLLLGFLWMPSSWLSLPSLPTRGGAWRCALATAFALFCATMLQGCGCTEPTAHLEWRPDGDTFNTRTHRIVDGIWRGNPSWIWSPHLESEDYQCVTMHSSGNFCAVWTVHEWNCGEHDFGICKCHQVASSGNYCEEWSCHTLEADQQICELRRDDDGETVSCWYSAFPMNFDTYNQLMERQEGGRLTTGEQVWRWWGYDSFWSYRRRLDAEQETAVIGDYLDYLEKWNATGLQQQMQQAGLADTSRQEASRRLQTGMINWPPLTAYNPAARHVHFWWGDVCIVNGDNTMIARRTCARWREIETEIQFCRCKVENYNGRSCAEWTCEERDVGLFSVLFRTKQPIDQYTVGVEFEVYKCTGYDIDGNCQSWEGDIESLEEVEWSKCFCPPAGCQSADAIWLCDEWELPKTRELFFEGHIGGLIAFIFAECFCTCLFFKSDDAEGDALFVATVASCIGGICLLPFLVLTYGFYGFLFAGGFFWTVRCCGCCICVALNVKIPKAERPSNQVRFQRGASKMLGRGASKNSIQPETVQGKVVEEPSNQPSNEPTNNVDA